MPSSQEDGKQRDWQLAIAALFIAAVLFLPVQVPVGSTEESLDDEHASLLFDSHDTSFSLNSLPLNGTSLALWSNDSIRASNSAQLTLSVEGTDVYTTLGDILRDTRKLAIPLPKKIPGTLRIRLASNGIAEKSALIIRMQQKNPAEPAYTLYGKKPLAIALIDRLYAEPLEAGDIEYVWQEGNAVLQNQNPYAKAATSDYGSNKFATYFPISYIASAIIQKSGASSFEEFTRVIRPIVIVSQLLTALCVLFYLYRKNRLILGILGFFLVMFHRFTLYPLRVAHIDFPAMFFLIVGMMLLKRKPMLAYLAIGLSLGIKQMAIFIIPIILIYIWQQYASRKQLGIALASIAIIPAIAFASFAIDNPKGVLASILFSVSRQATGDIATPDIAAMLSTESSLARILMFGLMALAYLAVWKKQAGLFGATLAVFVVFAGFNPVLFYQYLAWIIPFVPLAISEAALSAARLQLSRRFHNT